MYYHHEYTHEGCGLYRARDGMILGVCKGIAHRFDLSVWGVRIVLLLLMIPDFLIPVVAYLVAALLLRKAPHYVDL